jgi:hypothetical protein
MGKKVRQKEDKWITEIRKQNATIEKSQHTLSEKELKMAQKYMVKPTDAKAREESVPSETEKIFKPKDDATDFDAESRFANAKTFEYKNEKEEAVFAEDPKKEKYVHLSDDKDFVDKIDIAETKAKGKPMDIDLETLGKIKGPIKKGKKKK